MQYKIILLVVIFIIMVIYKILYIILTQRKIINLMADEILRLADKIAEKPNEYDIIPFWLGKKHILKYFRKESKEKR